jgi:hypothetical protein
MVIRNFNNNCNFEFVYDKNKINIEINNNHYSVFRKSEILTQLNNFINPKKYVIKFMNIFKIKNKIYSYFLPFKNINVFIKLYKILIENKIYPPLHEIISFSKVRLFFDIDITLDNRKKKVDYCNNEFTLKQLGLICCSEKKFNIDKFKNLFYDIILDSNKKFFDTNIEEKLKDVIIVHHNRKYTEKGNKIQKYSYHIIYPNFIFDNIESLNKYINTLFIDYKIIDKSIYYKNKTLRLPFTIKKLNDGHYSKIIYFKNNQYLNKDEIIENIEDVFINYDITNTFDGSDNLENIEVLEQNIIGDDQYLNNEDRYDQYKKILNNYLNLDFFKFEPNKNNNSKITLRPTKPYICYCCGDTHDNRPLFFTDILDGNVRYFNLLCNKYNDHKELTDFRINYNKRINKKKKNKPNNKQINEFYNQVKLMKDTDKINKIEFVSCNHIKNIKINTKYLEYKQFKKLFDTKHTILLSLPCGFGKSTNICNIYKDDSIWNDKNYCMIIITSRLSLNWNIYNKLYEIKHYRSNKYYPENHILEGIKTKDKLTSLVRIIQVESLNKSVIDIYDEIENNNNESNLKIILILDELPHTLKQLTSATTNKDNLYDNQFMFEWLLNTSDKVITMTGTPDKITQNYIINNRLNNSDYNNIVELSPNTYKSKRTIKLTPNRSTLLSNLYRCIENRNNNEYIGVIYTEGVKYNSNRVSKLNIFIKNLKVKYDNLNIVHISSISNSKIKEQFCKNPNKYIIDNKIDILIYTASLNVGVDIVIDFSYQFGFISYNTTTDPADIPQLIYRLRQLKSKTCYLNIERYNENNNTKDFNSNIKSIKDIVNHEQIIFNELNITLTQYHNNNINNSNRSREIENIIHKRTKYLKKNYIYYFFYYSYINCIDIELLDINCTNIDFHKELNKFYKELNKEDKKEFIKDLQITKIITEKDYKILNNDIDNTRDEMLLMTKYNIKNIFKYNGVITDSIFNIYVNNPNIIYTLRTIFKYDNYLNITENKTNPEYKIKNDKYNELINKFKTKYPTASKEYIEKYKKKIMVKLDISYEDTILYKETNYNISESLRNHIKFNILDILNTQDINICKIEWGLKSYKYKLYCSYKLIKLLNLPFLEYKVFSNDEFYKFRLNILHQIFKLKKKYNDLYKYFIGVINLEKTDKLLSKLKIKNNITSEDLKPITNIINKIYKIFGIKIFRNNKKYNHKVFIRLMPILCENISLNVDVDNDKIIDLTEDDKIPILNYSLNLHKSNDIILKNQIHKFNKLIIDSYNMDVENLI